MDLVDIENEYSTLWRAQLIFNGQLLCLRTVGELVEIADRDLVGKTAKRTGSILVDCVKKHGFFDYRTACRLKTNPDERGAVWCSMV